MKNKAKKESSVKIALWYLVGDLLVKGLAFITTPIFSRILTKEQYGDFSNFTAWESILLVFVTLDLSTSITRAKYDYGKQINQYISSITAVSTLVTVVLYLIVEWQAEFFTTFFSMDMFCVRILFIYLLFQPAYEYMQVKHRMYMKYKFFVMFSLGSALLRTLFSIVLVYIMEDKLKGRVLGYTLPVLILYVGIYIYIWVRGRSVKWEYCKYALSIGIPLIPHTLSLNLLASSDRVMIKSMWGAEQVALYTIPYTVASIVILVRVSLNKAWSPWFYDALEEKRYGRIKDTSKKYVDIFLFLMIGVMLVSPEIVLALGGEQYYEARFIIPPVMGGMVCQFIYTLYVNIEIYHKKTFAISIGTMMAAGLNIVLNLLFIPKFGYIAAAYTTLAGYFTLMLFHFYIVRNKLHQEEIFDNKRFLCQVGIFGVLQFICLGLYIVDIIRFIVICLYIVALVFWSWRNRSLVGHFIKRV